MDDGHHHRMMRAAAEKRRRAAARRKAEREGREYTPVPNPKSHNLNLEHKL